MKKRLEITSRKKFIFPKNSLEVLYFSNFGTLNEDYKPEDPLNNDSSIFPSHKLTHTAVIPTSNIIMWFKNDWSKFSSYFFPVMN